MKPVPGLARRSTGACSKRQARRVVGHDLACQRVGKFEFWTYGDEMSLATWGD